MKDHRKRALLLPWKNKFFLFLLLIFFFAFTFSTPLFFFRETFRPRLVSSWRTPAIEVISGESPAISVRETVMFPDESLIFLKYPQSTPLFTKDDITCVYFSPNSFEPLLTFPPVSVDAEYEYLDIQIVRCPLQPRGLTTTVAVKSSGPLPVGPTHRWDSLAYEAVIDRDNTTIVFVKGLNLRGGRVADPSRFKCVYGWDFTNPKLLLRSDALSVAQEIVRCKTPLIILSGSHRINGSAKVSVRVLGKHTFSSVARPDRRIGPNPPARKQHQMCVCTMLRNQAKFLQEWVTYHARIGVQNWFIYDNNSDDDIINLIESLNNNNDNFNITRHLWPWVKTQEAGFAHCALRARESCEWVGFVDVDEFLHLPSNLSLHDILRNQSSEVAELRVSCHSFGPSSLKQVPVKGVTIGYTCRMAAPERHKSIVKPEALNSTLVNLVHHFHLASGFKYVNIDRNVMVINHYKYQVWEVFKEKFHRRVATYVTDWQKEKNEGSKDRAPGLGTRAIEPANWSSRFCEVVDTGLRDRVVDMFSDPQTRKLPWQNHEESTI